MTEILCMSITDKMVKCSSAFGQLMETQRGRILLYSIIGCAVIGIIVLINKKVKKNDADSAHMLADRSDEVRQIKEKWTEKVKQKAKSVSTICDSNEAYEGQIVFTKYQADSVLSDIMYELEKTAELQGKVNSIADELRGKGGAGNEDCEML